MGVSNFYYIFYGTLIVGLAAVAAAIDRRSIKPLVDGFTIGAVSFVTVFVVMLPNLIFMADSGVQAPARSPGEQTLYGLRFVSALVPQGLFPGLSASYASVTPPTEGFNEFVGYTALVGLCIAFMTLLARMGGSAVTSKSEHLRLFIGFASLFTFLFALPYGLGLYFNLAISPFLRAQNRFSGFLVFWGIVALLSLLPSAHHSLRRRDWAIIALFIGLIFIDLKPRFMYFANASKANAPAAEQARSSVSGLLDALYREKAIRVAQLPIHVFPEAGPRESRSDYFHLLPFVFDDRGEISWSYGVTRDQPKALARLTAAERRILRGKAADGVRVLACLGYQAISLDRLAYKDRGAQVSDALSFLPIIHDDGSYRALKLPPCTRD